MTPEELRGLCLSFDAVVEEFPFRPEISVFKVGGIVRLNAGSTTKFTLPEGHTPAIFVLHGAVGVGDVHTIRPAELAVMQREGNELVLEAQQDTVLLLLNGEPLNEPVVGHGPFVMNSMEEIHQAIDDYNQGRFVAAA